MSIDQLDSFAGVTSVRGDSVLYLHCRSKRDNCRRAAQSEGEEADDDDGSSSGDDWAGSGASRRAAGSQPLRAE